MPLLLFICTLFALAPTVVSATQYTVSPPLVEHDLDVRGMTQDEIKISNTDNYPLRAYPSVNIVTVGTDGGIQTFESPVMTDETANPSSWVSVSRARVELKPGESAKIPVTISVHPLAKPGDYYVYVSFPEGDNRDDAERKVLRGGVAGTMFRITIADKTSEYLRLHNFTIDRYVTSDKQANISYELENVGDVAIIPRGEIILYDVRGQEVGSVEVNKEGKTILPNESASFKGLAPATGAFGRHKAFLNIEYGSKQRANLYDTAFYTVIPLKLIIISFVTLMVTALGLTLLYVRRSKKHTTYVEEDENVPLYVRKGVSSNVRDHDVNLRHE